eukprot:CAMPEP_0171068084 /NCGR_PEP_ID=MMETSP0766_2-20121228/8365_1 /TAXON_ID=439317 /ORGANISM="Gambierdiscus australes, Strain CAWD 149" /LENGTH=77 /DNA_ID=CAMNT_0011524365 /DNA_START=60 /DNA_END=290 /DNA_ORIENTATION=-
MIRCAWTVPGLAASPGTSPESWLSLPTACLLHRCAPLAPASGASFLHAPCPPQEKAQGRGLRSRSFRFLSVSGVRRG